MPNLYAAYLKAKEHGFDDWPIHWMEKEKGISGDIAQEIGELYSDDPDAVIEDCLKSVREWNAYPIDALNAYFDFELPDDFPTLSNS